MLTKLSIRRQSPLALLLLLGLALCDTKPVSAQAIDTFNTCACDTFTSEGQYSSAIEHFMKRRYSDEFAGVLADEETVAAFEDWEPPPGDATVISGIMNYQTVPSLSGATHGTIGPSKFSAKTSKMPVPAVPLQGYPPLIPGSYYTSDRGDTTPVYGWPLKRMPLRVYFAGDLGEARGGKLVRWYMASMNEWCRAALGKISYNVTYDFRNADIVVVRDLPNNCRLAENIPDFHNGWLDKVQIKLHDNTCDKLCEPVARAILLHEIGHSIGVFDHSTERRSVMYEDSSEPKAPALTLTASDRRGVKEMYESYWQNAAANKLVKAHMK